MKGKNKAEGGDGEGSGRETPEEVELLREAVLQVVKDKLSRPCAETGEKEEPVVEVEVEVEEEALLALSECLNVFIRHIYSRASEICKQDMKETLDAEHILKALKAMNFKDFVPRLRTDLKEFRGENSAKSSGKKAATDEKQEEDAQSSKDGPVADEK